MGMTYDELGEFGKLRTVYFEFLIEGFKDGACFYV